LSDDKLNDKNLQALIRAFKAEPPKAVVGILGTSKKRNSDGPTNSEIGFKHEFGDPVEHLPIRSFLRYPIIAKLQGYLDSKGAFTAASIGKVKGEKSLHEFVAKIGIACEKVIADAFKTGGWGAWRPSNMKLKKIKQTLVETQQLRDSIKSEVK
jgi:hypothetical protein